MPIRSAKFTGDLNDIKDLGWYRIDNASHSPANVGHDSWLLCLPHSTNDYMAQWLFPRGGSYKIYCREFNTNSWGSWYYIDFKVVQ